MSTTTRWRKKPVTVEAIRNDGAWAPVLAWLDKTGYTVPFLGKPTITRNEDGSLSIETLEGTMRANVGDWVIRGVQNEFYPCKPDVFAATYEPAAERDLADALLALPLPENDSGASTVRGYLVALLTELWREEEGFSGKRPFGNSGWQSDLYDAMVCGGLAAGDDDGITELGRSGADALILAAIERLGQ